MGDMPATPQSNIPAGPGTARKKTPFYLTLWGQVLIAVAIAVVYGYFYPQSAVKMKPLGDGFIRLITMVITLVIFCTVVTGIAGMENLKKVGRIGGKASGSSDADVGVIGRTARIVCFHDIAIGRCR